MSRIGNVAIIREFKCGGVYSVLFNGKQEIFIKNGDSIGAVQHYLNKPASECVGEIRDDVKQEFLNKLEESRIGIVTKI